MEHTNSPHCTNKHTHNAHLASTSLFPKGSKRNQPSSRGVLCKQAKGISTCGNKEQTRIQYQTGKISEGVLWWEILYFTSRWSIFCSDKNMKSMEYWNIIIIMASPPFPGSHSCPPCPSPRPPQWQFRPHWAPLDPAPAPGSPPSEGNGSSW